MLYILLLIYVLFLSEGFGRKDFFDREYRYNLVPFREIKRCILYWDVLGIDNAFMNLFGNVLAFLPFGFFLPILSPKVRKIGILTLLGFCLTFVVESIQLIFKVGCFDVDDLLLNTFGAFFGYLLFAGCDRIRRRIYEKKV